MFGGGAAQRSRDQGRGALADVAENLVVRKRISAQLRKGGVNGEGQVEFGIDQRAVQVEDQGADFGEAGYGVSHRIVNSSAEIAGSDCCFLFLRLAPRCLFFSFAASNADRLKPVLLKTAASRKFNCIISGCNSWQESLQQGEVRMAEIFPFRAYRYNAAVVDPAKVLTQPYDKITPAMAEKYAAASPYNLIPVEKGKTLPSDTPADNVYTRATKLLEEWIRARVIVQDAAPSMYAYFQEYTVPGTSERRVRKGFIAIARIEDYSAGVVFRHEQTLSGPKADRLELLRHTQTHTGQLFMMYTDPAARVDALLDAATPSKPDVELRDEYDVVHRLVAYN